MPYIKTEFAPRFKKLSRVFKNTKNQNFCLLHGFYPQSFYKGMIYSCPSSMIHTFSVVSILDVLRKPCNLKTNKNTAVMHQQTY